MSLEQLRSRIDQLDRDLVRLLNERTNVVLEVGKCKQNNAEEIYVPAREKKVLEKVCSLNPGPLPNSSLTAIYREIMSASLSLESATVIAYLGPEATFTHMAARARFGVSVEYLPCETVGDVFQSVWRKEASYGVVPIENSTEGAVSYTLDQFVDSPLHICAEIYLPVSHHLVSRFALPEIKTVYSHPQVFGQCRQRLNQMLRGVTLVPVSSTARAVQIAKEEPGSAAIASALAADLYGINVVEGDIQDLVDNTTRFLVVGKKYGEPTGADKTSLLFGVKHRAGALYDALGMLKKYGLNMTSIESRPCKTKAWEYYFFVDVEGHTGERRVEQALAELGEQCTVLKVLGSYPKAL